MIVSCPNNIRIKTIIKVKNAVYQLVSDIKTLIFPPTGKSHPVLRIRLR